MEKKLKFKLSQFPNPKDIGRFILDRGSRMLAIATLSLGLYACSGKPFQEVIPRAVQTVLPPTPTVIPTPDLQNINGTVVAQLQPTPTETPTPTATEIAKTIYQLSQERRAQWERFWPQTPEQAAEMFGGDSNKWQRNPDWPDDKKIQAPFLGVQDYTNIEWRYTGKPDDLEWPQTAEEATLKFFGVDPKTGRPRIPTKFIEIAWKNPRTGMVEGWHLTEDHWKETGKPADVAISIYAGVVVEGYSAAQTNDPKDDRNFVIWGGPVSKQITSISIPLLQGCTIWMPGTDPNAIALRMQLYPAGNDRPHYTGPNGEQLGPDAYGFTPVYPAANFVEKE